MNIITAIDYKYPDIGWVHRGGEEAGYSGLEAIKDDGTGSAIPDTDGMISEEEYNIAISEYEVIGGWINVRKERDKLLKESDYIMISDITITTEKKEEWTTYRQALRDIPQDYDSPDEVVYPDKPK